MELNVKNRKGESFTIYYDAEYHELISQYTWHAKKGDTTYYAVHSEIGKTIRMHRLLLNITNPKVCVDHKNHNGLDNRRINLRECTASENNRNKTAVAGRTSTYLGVCWDKANKKWEVSVRSHGKQKKIGRFVNEIEAAKAYDKAVIEIHGEFASLNFPL